MSEVVNVVVAFAVLVFVFKWATSGGDSSGNRSAVSALGFRPKNVTQQMLDQVHSMFPDIPPDNIRYDLLRTGSIEVTTNKILERGYLEAPPATYYTIYPRAETPAAPAAPASARSNASASSSSALPKASESLISRYNLQNRVDSFVSDVPETPQNGANDGKAEWQDTAQKREATLQERKAQMILAARQRMLAQQKAASAGGSP